MRPRIPSLCLDPLPPQPPEKSWDFVRELRTAPVHENLRWSPRRRRPTEAGFASGVRLDFIFDDPAGVLGTARADFRLFLKSVGLSSDGPYPIIVRRTHGLLPEQHSVRVTHEACELLAGDTEGIRRGLIWIEDEMLRRGGPFLGLGEVTRTARIRTRISRCFYGPVNRPPKGRDELADDLDYYPEEYLNRLAHEGVNALWITMDFFRSIPSRIIPEYGRNSGARLEKLRRTVRKCANYGIRIYPFCIEPAGFDRPAPEVAAAAAAHPELIGHEQAFCTSTALGQLYLEEATRTLFAEVPGLGGLIVIPVGERKTNCYSASFHPSGCPLCSVRSPHEVLAELLATMAKGMHSVNPGAELIAWPYGQTVVWGREATIEAARHIPPEVILQHNFETGGRNRQLGQWRRTWDYWLSYVGPSDTFIRCAGNAVGNGARIFAKLQVGCSHEVCTTQHVPVPGLLYRKYLKMRKLGVSGAMHSWYFGNYPSLMTHAAGELSFEPFPRSEEDFLLSKAGRDWGRNARRVVAAWRHFSRAYEDYPTAHVFGYFGPMHDGPVWPLHLVPRRLPLAPTWQIGYAPSGDYIAECIANGFMLEEVCKLCSRMAREWNRGTRILKGIRLPAPANRERLRDLRVAIALGLQFQSGSNILEFYLLREKLAEARRPARRLALLETMKRIVRAEVDISRELLPLARSESTLGFHSEAEGYKYFPALIEWRIGQLRRLLRQEFPVIERLAKRDAPLFPEYTGEKPTGAVYVSRAAPRPPRMARAFSDRIWDDVPPAGCGHWLRQVMNPARQARCAYDWADHLPVPEADSRRFPVAWKVCHDSEAIYFRIACAAASAKGGFGGEELQVQIEPRRTLPRNIFRIYPSGESTLHKDDGYLPFHDPHWRAKISVDETIWSVMLKIPFRSLGLSANPKRLRINILRIVPAASTAGKLLGSWVPLSPARGRLVWGFLNPATDFGWLKLVS